ncbi:Gifsy-2 prophage protein [Pseudomonas chlororaphis subsp. piscium]|nr:Gifsy-2 prophage protein [Pseudomonas chlororaphis subsp. piscium]AZC58127.1 Gifsy-2 prophage protein [Pseudomonas chlororaphis subsp. piscium]AZC64333.1 Gifsy-2 prophage protein [Pseudomonas chlororaphis subsp. piscium]AZC70585.1 Gifsy-2 prophage protein [Pseudomonas chlororaphis subsp. piscium]AZC76816.1 Gifsy-2 prophage protein [Pseudomonas chlororaphis subsp. piscium]
MAHLPFCASIGQLPPGDNTPSEHDGFVIITADSSEGMADTHDRRPIVFAPELAREWLNLAMPKERTEQMLIQQGEPIEVFEWFPVSKAVGNVRNQGQR